MVRETKPVRVYTEVQQRFAAACKQRGVKIQDKATEALEDKMIEWEAEDEWQARRAQAKKKQAQAEEELEWK